MNQDNSILSLSVIIPVYNEEKTIETILEKVSKSDMVNEIVIIDDFSSDTSVELIKNKTNIILEKRPELNIIFSQNKKNKGKGASIRLGFKLAKCEVIVIQDADLEYDPVEYGNLIKPIANGNADVVYGSRFIGGTHRVLYFWHYVGNKMLTLLSNMFSNLNLTDMETCYKMFRRDILNQFNLHSNRFGFEPEFTAKIAKARLRVYEIPISYYGRTYDDGKKITWKDGIAAFYHILRYNMTIKSVIYFFGMITLFILFYFRFL
ncbi:MAG: glycosyltransferase family 2 protein [Candidatus Neomarinimicrobiota bacterium]